MQQSLYWGTALFVIVFAVVHYNLYFVDQAQSFWSGETSPPARYVIIYLGGVPLALMMLVSCFLSTRTYAIESQFKIKEVLFTKPFGNLVHALSATTASTLFCALPMLGFVFIVFAVSAMQGWLSADVAEPFELVSTGVFLVFTTLVSLSFASLLSYFVYYAIRITILSVLASTAITTGIIYALTRVSFNQFVLFEFLPLVGDVASDMIADKLDYLDYCRFLAFVCLCATLTVGATWVVARRDQLQKLRVLLGGYLGAITSVCFAILFLGWFNQTSNIQKWQQHVMDVNDGITLDLQELSGSVVFAPGKNLAAEITVKGTLDDNVTKDDQLVFWLNPGFNVHGVQMDDRELPFEFDTGKLLVNLSHEKASSEQVELTIKYRGRPNTRYGYQDSSLDAANMPYWDQLISYYGMSPGVFDRKYVALPHATHWLPTSPRQTKLGASSIDFVEADLRINVPRDWVVILAGNASMQDLDKSDDLTRTFQFTTEQPLSGISLYANALNKYSTHLDAADVTFELYISERQLNLLQEFQNYEKYIEVFKTWMVEIIDEAKSQGYSFTCDTYRLVAVPSNLRVYGGGIFMDSVITEPCTYLIREHGAFATKLHEVIFFMGEDYDYTPAYRSNLEAYFRMRTNGGDLALGLADHFFKFDVGLKGPEGEYMKMVLSYLHHLVWTNTSYAAPYSPSVFFPRAMKVKRMTPKAEFLVSIHNMPMDDATLQFVLQDAV
ncbi:MAG: hypothetical protein F4Z87_04270, partial [Gammaproteobacteria bacterium]|nr:hypothetical protein [Gammaproteobacteria bacterium]